jgi:hypothetical protein
MKKSLFLILLICFISSLVFSQSVGIGTTTPSSSAQLDVQSINKGLLTPRLTTTQRNAIVNPAKGLLVYDSTIKSLFLHDGSLWKDITAGSSKWALTGNDINNINSGNVGIGTAPNPNAKLTVRGDSYFISAAGIGGSIEPDSTDLIINARPGRTNINPILPPIPAGDLILQYNVLSSVADGNVGIGVPAPSQKLSLDGGIGLYTSPTTLYGKIDNYSNNLRINAVLPNSNGTSNPAKDLILQYNNIGIQDAGNIGMGVAAPEGKLHIAGNNATRVVLGRSHTSGGYSALYMGTSALSNGYAYLQGVRSGGTAVGDIIMNELGGNVGIGVTTPEAKLHINSTGNPVKFVLGQSHTSGGYTALYMGTSALSNGYGYIQGVKSGGTAVGNIIMNELGGNIGVGTNNPLARLHMDGSGELIRVGSIGGNYTQIWHDGFQFFNNAQAKFFIEQTGDNLRIIPNASLPNGNLILDGTQVTIGQIAPATGYKLSVAGKAICEELKVQLNSAWPDYVFKNNYKLKSFDELRAFINTNNHLPNIPPAAELEKNGMEVGDMQKRMMEKIEELTLYILEIESELKEVKKKLIKK